jgi:hypothetical protein
MSKAAVVILELLAAWAVALCIGTVFTADSMVCGAEPVGALQPAAASLLWLAPSLVVVWLVSWAMRAIAGAIGLQWSRRDSALAMRPLLLGLICLVQPLTTYLGYSPVLLSLAALGTLWLFWTMLRRGGAFAPLFGRIESLIEKLGDGRAAAVLFVISLALYSAVAAGLVSTLPQPEGDEPHYLIISYSMIADGDIELSNNYYENRDYLRWHAYDGPAVGYAHTKKGKEGVRQEYSMHAPGLPLYLIPFMAAGLAVGTSEAIHLFTRLGMTLPAAALIALLFLTLRRLGMERRHSLAAASLAGVTVPILFFSYHIFTEVPAALLCLFAFYHLWPERSPGWVARIGIGLALGALPWLGPKYLALAAPLAVLWLVREPRWGFDWKKSAVPALPGLILFLTFLWLTYDLFGTFNPSAFYVGAGGSIVGKNPVFKVGHAGGLLEAGVIAGKTALSYWVDQKEGLLAFAPWFLLAIAGWIGMVITREQRRLALWLLALVGPFCFLYSLTGFGGGHSPPARAVTAIIWAFLIPAAWVLPKAIRRARELTFGLIILSLIISAVLLVQPAFLYHDFHVRASHVLTALSTPFLDATALFPSVNNKHFENWPVACVWMALLAVAIVWLSIERKGSGKAVGRWAGASVVVFAIAVVIWAALAKTPPLEEQTYQTGSGVRVLLQSGSFHLEGDAFWVRTGKRGVIYLMRGKQETEFTVQLRTVVPNIVRVDDGVSVREVRLIDYKRGEISVAPAGGFHVDGRILTRLSIESLRGVPAGSRLLKGDTRDLGVEVRLGRGK